MISLGVQVFVVSVGVAAFWVARSFFRGNYWIATILLLVLAALSLSAYRMILNRVDGLALSRRETLISELCRALRTRSVKRTIYAHSSMR
jgi:membrane protein implicated in regulation of membrane protease activity